jgi:hypothetical protein
MSNFIILSEPNSIYEEYPISFSIDADGTVLFSVNTQDKSIELTFNQFEEAIQHYIQVKAVQASSDRMKSNNTLVDYSKGGFIPKNQPCPFIFSDGKEA